MLQLADGVPFSMAMRPTCEVSGPICFSFDEGLGDDGSALDSVIPDIGTAMVNDVTRYGADLVAVDPVDMISVRMGLRCETTCEKRVSSARVSWQRPGTAQAMHCHPPLKNNYVRRGILMFLDSW